MRATGGRAVQARRGAAAFESILAPLRYREIAPPASLSASLECVWLLEGSPAAGRAAETIVPDGCVEIIVHLEDSFRRCESERTVTQPRGFLVGPMTRPLWLETPRRVRTVGIRFRPGGAAVLLKVPLSELLDRELALEDLDGNAARRLFERLAEARGDSGLARGVGAFIAETASDRPLPDRAVAAAVGEILRRGGQVTVERLASSCGMKPRTLERRFQSVVGHSPKRLARIVRFQRVFRELQSVGEAGWVDVAVRCGYFDQAHLIRDFRELSGAPPNAFFEIQGELSRQLTSPERLERFFAGA